MHDRLAKQQVSTEEKQRNSDGPHAAENGTMLVIREQSVGLEDREDDK